MRRHLITAVLVGAIAAAAGIGLAATSETDLTALSQAAGEPGIDTYDVPLEPSAPVGTDTATGTGNTVDQEPYFEEDSYSSGDSYSAGESYSAEEIYSAEDGYTDPLALDDDTRNALEARADARAAEIRASGGGTFEVPPDGIFDCIPPWDWTSEWSEADLEDYAQCLAAM